MGNTHGTGFNKHSTTDDVARDISLAGKNVIITGANTGLGQETARALARMGANVIMACRNVNKANQAKKKLENCTPHARLTVLQLDLADLQSVENFVESFKQLNLPLNILINNAGIMAVPYQETANGYEMQFGVNHLGHFHLTNLLLPKLIEGQPSRVVCLSSMGHKISGIRWRDIRGRDSWYEGAKGRWAAYGQSKTANILFAMEFNRRMHVAKHSITANAVHPGAIMTELGRDLGSVESFFFSASKPFLKSIPEGAATTVYCATAPELEGIGGRYFSDCNEDTPAPHASNVQYAQQLWTLSEEMVKNAPTAEEYAAKLEAQNDAAATVKKADDENEMYEMADDSV